MRYFDYSEFDQKDGALPGSGQMFMDKDFLKKLDELRHRCGFPFVITSGYRSPAYNQKVAKSGSKGPHTTGKAVDIKVQGSDAWKVLSIAYELGFTGAGVSQSGASRFIHLDTLTSKEGYPRPALWSY